MKGAFNIEIRRNGRLLKHNFNNRILKSGLEFQEKYSVSNATDSIITHLLIGGTHSDVTATTIAMDSTPIAAVPYIDYIKPDFLDEASSMFKNELVFKFEPTETIIIKQLATGRKNVTVIGGIDSVSYDYFSLANVMANEELSEIKLYPGDSLTITYTLLINTATTFSKSNDNNSANYAWNLLRVNRNWHLCGFNRRLQIAKETLNSYWELELTPWVYEKNLTVNTNEARYFYSRVMWQLPEGLTREVAKTNLRLRRSLDFAGAFPIWHNGVGEPSIYTINGKLHFEGTTASLYHASPVNSLYKYYIADVVGKESAKVGTLSSQIKWSAANPLVILEVKGSPLSLVIIKHGNKVIKTDQNSDYGYGLGNIGRSNKAGMYRFAMTRNTASLFDLAIPFTATFINLNNYVESAPFYLTLPTHNGWGTFTKAQYNPNGEFAVGLRLCAWNWDNAAAYRPDVYLTAEFKREGADGEVAWSKSAYMYASNNTDLVYNFTLPTDEERDYLDGSWKLVVKSPMSTKSTVSYELPLEKSIITTSSSFASSGVGAPAIDPAKPHRGGVSEILYSKVTITKK